MVIDDTLDIETEVQGHIDEIMAELAISSDLSTEFIKQASYYAHWAFLSARAQDTVRANEERVELSFYQLYREYKEEHSSAKENDCKSYVRCKPRHKKLIRALRQSQYNADLMRAAVRAFEMRRDMLVQLGAQNRAEHDSTDLKIKAQKATKVIKKTFGKKKFKPRDDV